MSWKHWLRSVRKAAGVAETPRLRCEGLESRDLPRPTLYVDFGDRFPGGVLNDTIGGLVTTKSGTNPAVNGPDLSFLGNPGDPISFRSMNSVFGPDAAAARQTVMELVRRYYEPTNVEVVELTATPVTTSTGAVVQAAASLADVSATLGANNKTQRKNDTYNFIVGGSANGFDLLNDVGLLGISNGTDIFNFNNSEGATISVFGDTFDNFNPTPVDIGVTAAHEAGHSFGLKHAYYTAGGTIPTLDSTAKYLQRSELMSYLTPAQYIGQSYAASGFFTRFPLAAGDGNTNYDFTEGANGTGGPFLQFLADPEVGPNPAYNYVTGTGANDLIAVSKTGANQATVTVSPFLNPDFTGAIPVPGTAGKSTSFTYTVTLDKPIVLDAGLGGDKITLDAALGVNVTVRGQGDDNPDVLEVVGTGSGTAVYTPGTNKAAYLDDSSDLQGSLVVGAMKINFSEFDPTSTVTVKDVGTVTFATPGGKDVVALTSNANKDGVFTGTVAGGADVVPLYVSGATALGVNTGPGDGSADDDTFTLDLTNGNPIPTGGLTYNGGAGSDTVIANADVDFTLAAGSLTLSGVGSIGLSNVESASLTGGPTPTLFAVAGWGGAVAINGDPADTVRVTQDTDFTLAGTKIGSTITASNGLVATLKGVTKAEVYGGSGANTFTVAAWPGTASLDGKTGGDTYVLDVDSPGVTIDESGTDAAIDTLVVAGTDGNDAVTVSRTSVNIGGKSLPLSGGKIEAVSVDGGAGDDTFTIDAGSGLFTGGSLNFTGGEGDNSLILTGTPTSPVAQGSLVFTGDSDGQLILDPDGSSGPFQTGTPGTDATVVPFTSFTNIVNTIPVGRFDVPFSTADDTITISKGAPVGGVNTVAVTVGLQSVRVARAGTLAVYGGGGKDRFTVDLTTSAGLSALSLYGYQGSNPVGKDDGAANTFILLNAAVPVTVGGGTGPDGITVGAAQGSEGGTDGILAAVRVEGGGGNDTLTLSDYGAADGNADVRITATGVTGLVGKTGTVPVTYTGMASLTVLGANADAAEGYAVDGVTLPLTLKTFGGADTIAVRNVRVAVALDAGTGDDAVTVTGVNSPTRLTVGLGEGNNTLRLTNVGGAGGASVSGGGGKDTLTATGVVGPLAVDAGGGDDDVAVTGANAPVAVNVGQGNNTVRVSGAVGGTGLDLLTGDGDDAVTLDSVTGAIKLVVGNGANALTLTNVTVPAKLAVATGNGPDTLRLVAVTAPGGLTVSAGGGDDTVTASGVRGPAVIDGGAGDDTISVGDTRDPATVTGGSGDDELVIGGPTLDALSVTPTVDGGAGNDRVTLNDSGNTADVAFAISAAGVARNGGPPLSFTAVESYGLTAGSGNNTFNVTGSPSGGVVVTDGAGNGRFAIAADALAGPSKFDGGAGSDSFAVSTGAGTVGAAFTLTGGDGRDGVVLTGGANDTAIGFTLTGPQAGYVTGLGGKATFAGSEDLTLDGAGGSNLLSFYDDSDTSYGTPLNPEVGIVVKPTGVGSGVLRAGAGPAVTLNFANFAGGIGVNGDVDGSGDADVLTVLGFSTTGLGVSGELSDGTSADGSDDVTVSDTAVVIANRSLGGGLTVYPADTNGAPTVSTLLVRTGNEDTPGGDAITATPSTRMNLIVDGMAPAGSPGSAGDKLTVTTRGGRSVTSLPDDAVRGPAQTRLTIDETGAGVGFNGFESAPLAAPGQSGAFLNVLATATGPGTPSLVQVYDAASGTLLYQFAPYEASFLGGVSVATGDVTGDGVADVIVGAGPGGGPHVQVYDGATQAVVQSFFPYEATFTGGVQVAAGDVDGDGFADIILGTGIGGGPRVQVVNGRTGGVLQNYFAYEESFRNGVQVSSGDVNGDGVADVVAGSGVGGGPRVRAFSGVDGSPLADFFAYDSSFRSGVNVAAGDLDGDGFADLVTGGGAPGPQTIRAFSGATGAVLADFQLDGVDPSATGPSIRVTTADLDGDGVQDIAATQGPGGRPTVRGYKLAVASDGSTEVQSLGERATFDDSFAFGVFVG